MSKIVLCDIDGTVANNDHRQHLLRNYKDWNKTSITQMSYISGTGKGRKPMQEVLIYNY